MDLLKQAGRRYSGDIQQKGFALPTVLILSIILLAIGVSTLQVGAAISRSLIDQHWNRLAKTAGQSAMTFLSSCYDQGGASLTATLLPNTTCAGQPVTPARDIYTSSDTSAAASPSRWRATYTIAPPTTGSDGIGRSKLVGKVEVLSPDDVVVKTYNWEYVALINFDFTKAIYFEAQGGHSCALTAEQIVFCAGRNDRGQLGNNSFVNSAVPVRFQLPSDNAVSISNGTNITCVLTADQSTYCAGRNDFGQLGNDSTVNSSTPVQFPLPAGEVAVSSKAGSDIHVCVLTAKGLVFCAGRNNAGALGVGDFADRDQPVQFPLGGLTATEIHLGGTTICAVTSDKQLYCSGENSLGQLGVGIAGNPDISSPARFRIPDGKTVEKVSAGFNNTCVITSDQLLYCAGHNLDRQLSNGNSTGQNMPVPFQIPLGKKAAYVGTSNKGTCVLTTDQFVYCIGVNDAGQLGCGACGAGAPVTPVEFPIPLGKKAAQLFNARYNTCVLTTDRFVYCAGQNYAGQLSNGNSIDQTSPVEYQLPAGKKAVRLISSSNTICVATNVQYGYCSGDNSNGQLGDGTTVNKDKAVRFMNP